MKQAGLLKGASTVCWQGSIRIRGAAVALTRLCWSQSGTPAPTGQANTNTNTGAPSVRLPGCPLAKRALWLWDALSSP